jgi:hypothetical protein
MELYRDAQRDLASDGEEEAAVVKRSDANLLSRILDGTAQLPDGVGSGASVSFCVRFYRRDGRWC